MTSRFASSACVSLLPLVLVLTATVASARDRVPPDRGALKAAAHRAFARGDFAKALREFRGAMKLSGDVRLSYNVGLCCWKRYQKGGGRAKTAAQDLRCAQRSFTRFLASTAATKQPGKARVPAKARTFAREYLQAVQREQRRREDAAKAAATKAAATKARARPSTPAGSDPPPPAGPAGASRRWAHWVLYGSAAAALVAGVIVGGLALSDESSAADLGAEGDFAAANRRADSADRLSVAADVLLVGAAVLGAAGLLLHLLRPGHARAPRDADSARASQTGLTATVGLVGVGLRWRY